MVRVCMLQWLLKQIAQVLREKASDESWGRGFGSIFSP